MSRNSFRLTEDHIKKEFVQDYWNLKLYYPSIRSARILWEKEGAVDFHGSHDDNYLEIRYIERDVTEWITEETLQGIRNKRHDNNNN